MSTIDEKNKIKEYKKLIEDLDKIGIQKYTNNFIWNKMFYSSFFKGSILGIIGVSISFFIIGLPITAFLIPILLFVTTFGINFWLYRIFFVEKYAKKGSEDYMFKMNIYKDYLNKLEYDNLKNFYYSKVGYPKYEIKMKIYNNINLLQASFYKFEKVVNSQTIIDNNLKSSLLFNANKTYGDGIVILKEIYDIFMAEEHNKGEMLEQNKINIEKLLNILIQMKDSFELGALEVPQITSSQASISKAESSINTLKNSFEQAKLVQGNVDNLSNIYNKYNRDK